MTGKLVVLGVGAHCFVIVSLLMLVPMAGSVYCCAEIVTGGSESVASPFRLWLLLYWCSEQQ